MFKFAGDAIIVVWPPSGDDLKTLSRRAAQCGMEIKEFLQDAKLAEGVRLCVKVRFAWP